MIYLVTFLTLSGNLQSGFVAFAADPVENYGLAFIFSLTGYCGANVVLTLVRTFGNQSLYSRAPNLWVHLSTPTVFLPRPEIVHISVPLFLPRLKLYLYLHPCYLVQFGASDYITYTYSSEMERK